MPFLALHRRRNSESFSELLLSTKKSVSGTVDNGETCRAAPFDGEDGRVHQHHRRRKWGIMSRIITGKKKKESSSSPELDGEMFERSFSIDNGNRHFVDDDLSSSGFGTMSSTDGAESITTKKLKIRKRLLMLLKPSRRVDERKLYSTFRDDDDDDDSLADRDELDGDESDGDFFLSSYGHPVQPPGMKMKRKTSSRHKNKRKNSDAVSESNMSSNADPGVNSDSEEDEAFKDEIAVGEKKNCSLLIN